MSSTSGLPPSAIRQNIGPFRQAARRSEAFSGPKGGQILSGVRINATGWPRHGQDGSPPLPATSFRIAGPAAPPGSDMARSEIRCSDGLMRWAIFAEPMNRA